MAKKINWLKVIGLAYAIAASIFIIVFCDAFFDEPRLQPFLFDYGVDAMGSLVCAALFYGCFRQKGSGMMAFRVLILLLSISFLLSELMLFFVNVPEWRNACFILTLTAKLLDLFLIFLFYYFIKKMLSLSGKLVKVSDVLIPVLFALEALVILVNIFYPLTFAIDSSGRYSASSIALIEDVYLMVAAAITVVLILLSHGPWNQKIAALTFIVFPLLGRLTLGNEFGSASQYGYVLMSLIVMYCVIFNDKSKLLTATETELNTATEIQASILPSSFPAFPDRREFDIHASMDPAKEVGGDFYDFFLIDDDHLAMVIGDVSGKGVPAALFMMSSKILINDHATIGGKPSEILERVNKLVYATNKAHMFVTVWLGILEISTGKLITSNAGHEYPILSINGKYELIKDKHGLAIGAMPSSKYTDMEFTLRPGDQIFVYTDGVAEATNASKKLFGTAPIVETLNSMPKGASQKDILLAVRSAVDAFVLDAPQFDDLTMLGLRYNGPTASNEDEEEDMERLVIEAKRENLLQVQGFVDGLLEQLDCPMKTQMAIDVAVEEIFVNIASYAYGDGTGEAIIEVRAKEDPLSVEITFIDSGTPYNPLAKEDPNTSLSLMERKKGGLGIFMVKKSMDDMTYEYRDGKNILTIKKKLN